MDFGTAVNTCFRKYATVTGRAERREYWFFVLFNFLVSLAATVLDSTMFGAGGLHPLNSLVAIALLVPSIAVGVRRLHDTGRSGWWLLLIFIPVVGLIVLLVFTIQRGEPNDNMYGPAPAPLPTPTPTPIPAP